MGPPLGERLVPFVHVRGDVVERERTGEGRRFRRLDLADANGAGANLRQELAKCRQVEHILQTLAVRFENDGKVRVARGDGEEVCGTLSLQPERRPSVRPATGEQERASGVLAESRSEEGRLTEPLEDESFDLLRRREEGFGGRGFAAPSEAEGNPIVAPDGLDFEPCLPGEARLDGQRPGGVDLRAERREDDYSPVAELVEIALDEDEPIVRHRTSSCALFFQVGDEVLGRELIQRARFAQTAECPGPVPPQALVGLAEEGAEGATEFSGPSRAIAAPEGNVARLPRSGRDDDAVGCDPLDAPSGGPEDERLTWSAFEDHLLVQFADTRPAFSKVNGVEAAVGDGASADEGEGARLRASGDRPGRAVPDEPRAEVGELVGGVRAGEHRQDGFEGGASEVGERVGATHDGVKVVDAPRLDGRHGDDLLGEDVEGIPRHAQGFDGAFAHPLDEERALREVSPMLGEDATDARGIEGVPRAAHALQGTGDGLR